VHATTEAAAAAAALILSDVRLSNELEEGASSSVLAKMPFLIFEV